MNAVVGRGLNTKTYMQGSYFGDIEAFTNIPRIFSARAEEPTVLVVFEKDHVNKVLSSHTQSHLNTYKMTFKRYFKYKISVRNLEIFSKLNMNDPFWIDKKGLRDEIINRDIRKLFEQINHYHNHSSRKHRKKGGFHDQFVLYPKKRYFDPTIRLILTASRARKNFRTGVTSLMFINNLKKSKGLRKMMSFSRTSRRGSSRKLASMDEASDDKEPEILTDFNLKFEYFVAEIQKRLDSLGKQLDSIKKKMRVFGSPSPRSPKGCKNCCNLRLDLDELIADSTNLTKSEIVSRLKSLVCENSDIEPSVLSDFEADPLFGPVQRMVPETIESLGNIKNEGMQSGKLPQTTIFSSENRILQNNKESGKESLVQSQVKSPVSKNKILHKKPSLNRSSRSKEYPPQSPFYEVPAGAKTPNYFPPPHPSKFQTSKTPIIRQRSTEANHPRHSLTKFGLIQDQSAPVLAKQSPTSNLYVLRNNFTKEQKPPPNDVPLLKYTSNQH